MLQKFGLAFALGGSSLFLGAAGYDASLTESEQPESVSEALRLLVGPIPSLLMFVAFLCTFFYPLTREVHGDVRRRLLARQMDQTSDEEIDVQQLEL